MSADELREALGRVPTGCPVVVGDSWGDVVGLSLVDGVVVIEVAGVYGVSDVHLAGDVSRVGVLRAL
jgi:hypothetical protein